MYLKTCKYFEIHLRPFNFIHQVDKVNPTQVVERSLEPPSKALFRFMPEPEAPFQSHSNTNDYLAAPCVSMDTNSAKH